MKVHTHCRLCDGACGLVADIDDNRILAIEGDPSDPVSEGFVCDDARASLAARTRSERFTQPMRRTDDGLVPVSWDEALREIGDQLRSIRGQSGARSTAVYLGDEPWRSTTTLTRSMAFAVAMGTPNLFSELCMGAGPRLRMAELMLGWPAPLLSDLGRAHYVLLLDSEQGTTDWGPWNYGMAHERWITHSRRTKKTKVAVASPRKTELAAGADSYLAIRPGTEAWFLLGLLSAVVTGGRHDHQYVRDYTTGWDRLVDLLSAWPVDRCAAICGIEPAELAGVSLRFARAAMAVAHPGPSTFAGSNASVAAWAWMALHAVTANLLRPGGLYDHEATFDMYPPLAASKSRRAPRTRVADHSLLLLQAPATLLPDEALVPGEGQVRALVCVSGDPAHRLPGGRRVLEALDSLDLLVCLAREPDATTERAHWVLPITHPWEQDHLYMHECALLPRKMTAWTPALVPPVGDARHPSDILAELYKATHPGMRGSAWGMHLRLLARWLATADLDQWLNKQVDWMLDEGASPALQQAPNRFDEGDADRSPWRVDHPGERIDLVPEAVAQLLRNLEEPTDLDDHPLRLRTSGRAGRVPGTDAGLRVHPDTGIADGARVRVRTPYGETEAIAHHDPHLRPDVADLPFGGEAWPAELLSGARVDPLSGAPELDGVPCRVEAR